MSMSSITAVSGLMMLAVSTTTVVVMAGQIGLHATTIKSLCVATMHFCNSVLNLNIKGA
jgi:hypothetical protein